MLPNLFQIVVATVVMITAFFGSKHVDSVFQFRASIGAPIHTSTVAISLPAPVPISNPEELPLPNIQDAPQFATNCSVDDIDCVFRGYFNDSPDAKLWSAVLTSWHSNFVYCSMSSASWVWNFVFMINSIPPAVREYISQYTSWINFTYVLISIVGILFYSCRLVLLNCLQTLKDGVLLDCLRKSLRREREEEHMKDTEEIKEVFSRHEIECFERNDEGLDKLVDAAFSRHETQCFGQNGSTLEKLNAKIDRNVSRLDRYQEQVQWICRGYMNLSKDVQTTLTDLTDRTKSSETRARDQATVIRNHESRILRLGKAPEALGDRITEQGSQIAQSTGNCDQRLNTQDAQITHLTETSNQRFNTQGTRITQVIETSNANQKSIVRGSERIDEIFQDLLENKTTITDHKKQLGDLTTLIKTNHETMRTHVADHDTRLGDLATLTTTNHEATRTRLTGHDERFDGLNTLQARVEALEAARTKDVAKIDAKETEIRQLLEAEKTKRQAAQETQDEAIEVLGEEVQRLESQVEELKTQLDTQAASHQDAVKRGHAVTEKVEALKAQLDTQAASHQAAAKREVALTNDIGRLTGQVQDMTMRDNLLLGQIAELRSQVTFLRDRDPNVNGLPNGNLEEHDGNVVNEGDAGNEGDADAGNEGDAGSEGNGGNHDGDLNDNDEPNEVQPQLAKEPLVEEQGAEAEAEAEDLQPTLQPSEAIDITDNHSHSHNSTTSAVDGPHLAQQEQEAADEHGLALAPPEPQPHSDPSSGVSDEETRDIESSGLEHHTRTSGASENKRAPPGGIEQLRSDDNDRNDDGDGDDDDDHDDAKPLPPSDPILLPTLNLGDEVPVGSAVSTGASDGPAVVPVPISSTAPVLPPSNLTFDPTSQVQVESHRESTEAPPIFRFSTLSTVGSAAPPLFSLTTQSAGVTTTSFNEGLLRGPSAIGFSFHGESTAALPAFTPPLPPPVPRAVRQPLNGPPLRASGGMTSGLEHVNFGPVAPPPPIPAFNNRSFNFTSPIRSGSQGVYTGTPPRFASIPPTSGPPIGMLVDTNFGSTDAVPAFGSSGPSIQPPATPAPSLVRTIIQAELARAPNTDISGAVANTANSPLPQTGTSIGHSFPQASTSVAAPSADGTVPQEQITEGNGDRDNYGEGETVGEVSEDNTQEMAEKEKKEKEDEEKEEEEENGTNPNPPFPNPKKDPDSDPGAGPNRKPPGNDEDDDDDNDNPSDQSNPGHSMERSPNTRKRQSFSTDSGRHDGPSSSCYFGGTTVGQFDMEVRNSSARDLSGSTMMDVSVEQEQEPLDVSPLAPAPSIDLAALRKPQAALASPAPVASNSLEAVVASLGAWQPSLQDSANRGLVLSGSEPEALPTPMDGQYTARVPYDLSSTSDQTSWEPNTGGSEDMEARYGSDYVSLLAGSTNEVGEVHMADASNDDSQNHGEEESRLAPMDIAFDAHQRNIGGEAADTEMDDGEPQDSNMTDLFTFQPLDDPLDMSFDNTLYMDYLNHEQIDWNNVHPAGTEVEQVPVPDPPLQFTPSIPGLGLQNHNVDQDHWRMQFPPQDNASVPTPFHIEGMDIVGEGSTHTGSGKISKECECCSGPRHHQTGVLPSGEMDARLLWSSNGVDHGQIHSDLPRETGADDQVERLREKYLVNTTNVDNYAEWENFFHISRTSDGVFQFHMEVDTNPDSGINFGETTQFSPSDHGHRDQSPDPDVSESRYPCPLSCSTVPNGQLQQRNPAGYAIPNHGEEVFAPSRFSSSAAPRGEGGTRYILERPSINLVEESPSGALSGESNNGQLNSSMDPFDEFINSNAYYDRAETSSSENRFDHSNIDPALFNASGSSPSSMLPATGSSSGVPVEDSNVEPGLQGVPLSTTLSTVPLIEIAVAENTISFERTVPATPEENLSSCGEISTPTAAGQPMPLLERSPSTASVNDVDEDTTMRTQLPRGQFYLIAPSISGKCRKDNDREKSVEEWEEGKVKRVKIKEGGPEE